MFVFRVRLLNFLPLRSQHGVNIEFYFLRHQCAENLAHLFTPQAPEVRIGTRADGGSASMLWDCQSEGHVPSVSSRSSWNPPQKSYEKCPCIPWKDSPSQATGPALSSVFLLSIATPSRPLVEGPLDGENISRSP